MWEDLSGLKYVSMNFITCVLLWSSVIAAYLKVSISGIVSVCETVCIHFRLPRPQMNPKVTCQDVKGIIFGYLRLIMETRSKLVFKEPESLSLLAGWKKLVWPDGMYSF